MDGTLIDSIGIWNAVDRELISEIRTDGESFCGDVQKQRDEILALNKAAASPYHAYCGYLKEKYRSSLSADEIHDLRYKIAARHLEYVIDYKIDADIFIKALKKRGFILAIATDTRRKNMDIYRRKNKNIIEKAPVDEYFSFVFTREDASEMKPNPEIYLKTLKALGLSPEDCIAFEDSLAGVTAAKAAGLYTVAVYDEYSDKNRAEITAAADLSISGYTEILNKVR